MKKIIIALAVLCASSQLTYAQEKYVTAALTALSTNDLEEAKTNIDKAMASPETKEKPKALYAKLKIYEMLDESEKYKGNSMYKEATEAIIKLMEVKPDYKTSEVTFDAYRLLIRNYNAGITYNNEKKSAEFLESMKTVLKLKDVSGARFAKESYIGKIDTIVANSQLNIAYIAYSSQNYEEAITQYNKVLANKITKDASNTVVLLESYAKYNAANGAKLKNEELAALNDARAAYPSDPNIRNMELNALTNYNMLSDLLKKLEAAAEKEPNMSDNHYNIGLLYQNMSAAKDGKKPQNAPEMMKKAEASFQKALKLAPENGLYNYNFGTYYFNQAVEFNDEMNKITGSSKADNDKYDALKVKRDGMFDKASVYLEKSYSIYSAMPASQITGDNAEIYRSTITALKQIYAVNNKNDKLKELADKMKQFGW